MNAMVKMLKLFVPFMIFSLLLTGCRNDTSDNGNTPDTPDYQLGELEYRGLGPCSTVFDHMMSYYSDKNVFDINDVDIELYFGHCFSDSNLSEQRVTYRDVELVIERYGSNDDGEIRSIGDAYNSDAYKFTYGSNIEFFDKYAHHETISIPKRFFTSKCGTIRISLKGIPDTSEDGKWEYVSSSTVSYRKLDGERVLLGTLLNAIKGNTVFDKNATYDGTGDLGIRVYSKTNDGADMVLSNDVSLFEPGDVTLALKICATKNINDEGLSILLIENSSKYNIWEAMAVEPRIVTVVEELDLPFTVEKYGSYDYELHIPEEFFKKDSDRIEIRIGAPNPLKDLGYSTVCYLDVYYAKIGDKILLARDQYELIY